MRAIILAGGKSTRLLPQTKDVPKCLLTIDGRAIIDYQIETLLENKVDDIVVVTGFHSDKLISHLRERFPTANFTFVENEKYEHTGPSYGLWLTRGYMDHDFLYLNADLFCRPEIMKMILEHEREHLTAVQKIPWNEEAVNVTVGESGQVHEIGKHIHAEKSHGEFIGMTKIGRDFAKLLIRALEDFVASGEENKFAVDAINAAIQAGGILHILDVSHLSAIEIDTPKDYEEAQNL